MDENAPKNAEAEKPWAGIDPQGNGTSILLGNRAGLIAIRNTIDRALVSDADAAIFEGGRDVEFSHILVTDKDPREERKHRPNRKKEAKEAITLLIVAVVCVAVAMVFGFGVIYLWKLSHGTLH
jgi:hypothetical protein